MRNHRPHRRAGVLLLVGVLVGGVCLGAVPVSADEHTKDDAVNVTAEANFSVTLPYRTDHYPGGQNRENGSIEYYFTPEGAFAELGIEDEGAFGDYLIIDATWIDYSACSVDNTAVFGIDRGSNESGTGYDQDLVSKQKQAVFRDDGLTIQFYDWGDFANDPPYMSADDQIVAAQGAGSNGGTCLTMTNDPGWYRIQGFLNGTAADNGPNERPSENAKGIAGMALSNYVYVCECDSEAAAREELGPPPSERSGSVETATPTPKPATEAPVTPTAEPTPTPATATEVPETPTAEPTPTLASADSATGTATPASDGGSNTGNDGPKAGETRGTPTPAEGPGFGAVGTLVGLLAGGLLARRL